MWLYILYIYFTFAISLFRLVPFLSPKNKVKYLFYATFKIGLEGKYLIFVLSDLVFLVILEVYADQIYSYFTFLPFLQKNNNFSSGTISSGLLSCLLYICSYYFCCHYLLLLSTVAPLKKLLVSLFLSSTLPPFLFLFLSPPHPTLWLVSFPPFFFFVVVFFFHFPSPIYSLFPSPLLFSSSPPSLPLSSLAVNEVKTNSFLISKSKAYIFPTISLIATDCIWRIGIIAFKCNATTV